MTDEGIGPNDWRVKNAEGQFLALDGWIAFLERLSHDSIVGFDAWLALCLIKSGRLAYIHMRAGWHSDSAYVAWGCRNLLELRIFGKYVAKSPENRKRFTDDMTVDASQSLNAVVEMDERLAPGLTLSDQDVIEMIEALRALKEASGYEGAQFLVTTKLAVELGLKDELSIYKICSKLIHPTAQSILLVGSQNQDERDALFLHGCRYLFDLMDDMARFVAELQAQTKAQPYPVHDCPPKSIITK